MREYYIRALRADDYKAAAAVYNSNPVFLRNHLGMKSVDEEFIAGEAAEMCGAGFLSCAIVEREREVVQGVLDYKPGLETYLSLLMLSAEVQGKGAGYKVYLEFEDQMRKNGCTSIRIDVVNDYPGNLLFFWKKFGFCEGEEIELTWGNKKSRAVVMRKSI